MIIDPFRQMDFSENIWIGAAILFRPQWVKKNKKKKKKTYPESSVKNLGGTVNNMRGPINFFRYSNHVWNSKKLSKNASSDWQSMKSFRGVCLPDVDLPQHSPSKHGHVIVNVICTKTYQFSNYTLNVYHESSKCSSCTKSEGSQL